MKFFIAFATLVAMAIAAPMLPSPVVIGPIAPGEPAPLVQLIVYVNSLPFMPGAPTVVPGIVDPIQVVEEAEAIEPVIVIDTPITVPAVVEPVQVVEVTPVIVEPIVVGNPTLPAPAVILPEELN